MLMTWPTMIGSLNILSFAGLCSAIPSNHAHRRVVTYSEEWFPITAPKYGGEGGYFVFFKPLPRYVYAKHGCPRSKGFDRFKLMKTKYRTSVIFRVYLLNLKILSCFNSIMIMKLWMSRSVVCGEIKTE